MPTRRPRYGDTGTRTVCLDDVHTGIEHTTDAQGNVAALDRHLAMECESERLERQRLALSKAARDLEAAERRELEEVEQIGDDVAAEINAALAEYADAARANRRDFDAARDEYERANTLPLALEYSKRGARLRDALRGLDAALGISDCGIGAGIP